MTGVSTDNSTSKIDELLGNVGQVYDKMETGMGDNTTPQEGRLLVQNLSENDAVMYFCFHKVHLQEVAEKLWPWFQFFLRAVEALSRQILMMITLLLLYCIGFQDQGK